jgi:flavodoxin
MKTLVAFYSRTGHTKKVAEAIAKELGADLEEIIDKTNRSGLWGWLMAGRDAFRKRLTTIEKPKKDPAHYELVICGSPLWAFISSSPAIRSYVLENAAKLKRVAFFLTMGGTKGKRALEDLEKLGGKKAIATLEIKESEIASQIFSQKVSDFCRSLK